MQCLTLANRSGQLATRIVLLPDADLSYPDNDSDDEDIPLAHYSKKKLVNENSSPLEVEDGSSSSSTSSSSQMSSKMTFPFKLLHKNKNGTEIRRTKSGN